MVTALALFQILPPGFADAISLESQIQKQIPEKPVLEVSEEAGHEAISQNSIDFLSQNSPLSPATPDGYDYDRYNFEEALDLLRPEYASAAIVKSLSEDHLKSLLNLSFEVAIIVLEGEIVLFSTGNGEEIDVTHAAQELLKHASFISHTHVTPSSQDGPSRFDLSHALRSPLEEYVLTKEKVIAYNQDGIQSELTYSDYLALLQDAQTTREEEDSVNARSFLNAFIHQMDLYNQSKNTSREVFRQAVTDPAFQESSGLLIIDAEHAHENMARGGKTWELQNTTSGYSGEGYFTSSPDSGTLIDTGYTTTSPELKYQVNFQTPGTYYVWVRGWAPSGDSNSIHLGLDGAAITTSDRIQISTDYNRYVWTKSTSDNLRASLNVTTPGNHTLNLWMREDGFRFDKILLTQDPTFIPSGLGPNESGRVTQGLDPPTVNALSPYTNQSQVTLQGTKPTNTSIWVNGVEVVANNALTTWSTTLAISGDGLKTFNITAKDSQGNASTQVSVSTILDTISPVILPFDLPEGYITDVPLIVVPFQIQDANPVVTEDDVSAELVEGTNDILLTATDQAGNVGTLTISLIYEPVDSALTAQEKALRQRWLEENSAYFTEQAGINPATGFPIDVIGTNAPGPDILWTQPTSIGFYLQFLGNLISKRLTLANFTQAAAVSAAEKTLTTLLDVQTQFGWNGLIPWLRLDGTLRPDSSRIGLIDNANLTHYLAAFLGLLEKGNLHRTFASSLYGKAKSFMDGQREGYLAFVDVASGVFRGVYDTAAGVFDGFADRFGSEFRATIPFLIEYFSLPLTVWTNLIRSTSAYPTQEGRTVETFSTFDGGAFQYFWPLLASPEESLPKISSALQNVFLIFSDFMERKALAGFPSAASLPEGGYSAQLGINFLKETPGLLDETVASLYALASAYRLNPSWVLSKIEEIEANFPSLTAGPLGFYDAMRSNGAVSENYYAIDQGSLVLGLLGTGADDFQSFLEKRNLWAGYESHYATLDLAIPQAVSSLPEPPMSTPEIDSRDPDSSDLYQSGYDFDGVTGNGIAVSETSPGIFTYTKTAPSGWVGGFVTPPFDRNNYDYVVIEARSLSGESNQVRFELKEGLNFILQKVLTFEETGWHTFQFFFPKDTASIDFIAFADPTNDFEVRKLIFSDTPVFQGAFPPSIIQTSPALTTQVDYLLTYTVNGFLRSEIARLSEGGNVIRRAFENTFGEKVSHDFNITLNTTSQQVEQTILTYYGGSLPQGASLSIQAIKDSQGILLYYLGTVILNQSQTPGELKSQLFYVKEIAAQY
ncbi:MAG: hypothetical protein HY351_02180, partial [Candidatus Omnitrophica bacterium]|nr:hypothetical protein [Candidatus Omnitrophota bacterium]